MGAPEWNTPEWHREHPIFGTDFSEPPHVLIEEIRCHLARLRGQFSDIGRGYPGWREQLDCAEGLLTCGISYLYGVKNEMETVLARRTASDAAPPDAKGAKGVDHG
jgi:hypothetical protein